MSIGACTTPIEPEGESQQAPPSANAQVELPREYIDTRYPAVTGTIHNVPAGGDLQAAIDAAQPGDEIVLEAGATYSGSFFLREKSGDGWIVIRSGAPLPPEGTRLDPAQYAGSFAKIVANAGAAHLAAIWADPRASHYRLVGLEITAEAGVSSGNALMRLGDSQSLAEMPHHIVLDRSYVHGHDGLSFQRCLLANGHHIAVIDSYLSECHSDGFDAQAIVAWSSPGPFKIVNNYLEASGENVMFGGADPSEVNMVPSDIEIRRNHFYKPPSWKGVWAVKNLLEFKNGQRVLIEANVFENNWADAQAGFAVLLEPTNDGGGCTWCTTQDITFRLNWITNSTNGLNIAGGGANEGPMARVYVHDNVIDRIGGASDFGGRGAVIQLLGSHEGVTIAHNTVFPEWGIIVGGGGGARGFVFQANVVGHSDFGLKGSGTSEGETTLNDFMGSDWTFEANVMVGRPSSSYPGGNYFPPADFDVGFAQPGADYQLGSTSPFKGVCEDGRDPGADVRALESAISGVR